MPIQKGFDPIVDREAACYTLVIQSVAANSCSVVPELSRYRCLSTQVVASIQYREAGIGKTKKTPVLPIFCSHMSRTIFKVLPSKLVYIIKRNLGLAQKNVILAPLQYVVHCIVGFCCGGASQFTRFTFVKQSFVSGLE